MQLGSYTHRVLLVEDDPIHARVVKGWLSKAGYWVECAHTLVEAMAALRQRWDIIVSDCDLPDGTGLELARLAKLASPRTPFVMVTATQQPEKLADAVRAGVDDVLLKLAPLRSEELIVRMAELNEKAQATREVVLAIGALPSSVEVGCAGALLQHAADGHRVVILTVCRDSEGGITKEREALKAARMMGAELVLGDVPIHELAERGRTIQLIDEAIRAFQPTKVYAPSPNDRQDEQRAVARASLAAAEQIPHVVCYQSPSTTVDFRPSLFVTIDRYLAAKLKVLGSYHVSQPRDKHLHPEHVTAHARYWARYTAGEGAEPFEVIRASA